MAVDTPPPPPPPQTHEPQILDNIRNASSNLATAISNQLSAGVNRTANLVNHMSDVLALALNTTKQLSFIDQTQRLGGRLSNASAQFLNTTSNTVATILKTKLNAINAMVSGTNNIANTILQNASRFVTNTGQLLSRIIGTSSLPHVIPKSISSVTDRLLKSSIHLVNLTDHSLANVINATAKILEKSVNDNNDFVTAILNRTAHLINSTTDSLEHLLNTTNHLIAGVIQSRVNASNTLLNGTSNLLNASAQTINSLLNATTVIINNSQNAHLTRDASSASLSALESAENSLSKIFNRTSGLLHGVLVAEENIEFNLINATEELSHANFQIRDTLLNATRDYSNNASHSIVNFVESQLSPALNSNVSESTKPTMTSNESSIVNNSNITKDNDVEKPLVDTTDGANLLNKTQVKA